MLDLKYALRWRVASLALLTMVTVATLMRDMTVLDQLEQAFSIDLTDKQWHFLAFTFLAIWFCGLYARFAYWRILLGLITYGAFIEIVQGMVGYRTAEWMDLLADAGGILTGLVIGLAGAGGWSQRVEQWLDKRHE